MNAMSAPNETPEFLAMSRAAEQGGLANRRKGRLRYLLLTASQGRAPAAAGAVDGRRRAVRERTRPATW
jgi:hypothetical protein